MKSYATPTPKHHIGEQFFVFFSEYNWRITLMKITKIILEEVNGDISISYKVVDCKDNFRADFISEKEMKDRCADTKEELEKRYAVKLNQNARFRKICLETIILDYKNKLETCKKEMKELDQKIKEFDNGK